MLIQKGLYHYYPRDLAEDVKIKCFCTCPGGGVAGPAPKSAPDVEDGSSRHQHRHRDANSHVHSDVVSVIQPCGKTDPLRTPYQLRVGKTSI